MNDDPTPEVTSAEAVQKTKEAAQAVERAREVQMNTANLESEKRILDSITDTIKDAFKTDNGDGQKKFIDITRIPLICHDIATMRGDIATINDNLKWGPRVVIGAVILALIGMVLK